MTQQQIEFNNLKSIRTKETYEMHWSRYQKTNPSTSKKPQIIEDSITTYLLKMKDERLSYDYRNNALSAIHHYFKTFERRLVLNWEYIRSYLGEKTFDNEIRGYTREEIAKMLSISDVKYKAIILALVSTVMRREALTQILKTDLEYIEEYKLYKIKIYKHTQHEQICFTTPEAATAINLYLEYNKNDTHKELFYFKSRKNLTTTLRQIQIRSGVGQAYMKSEGKKIGQKRNEIPATHGVRKFGITQMAKSGISEEKRKILSGHSIGVQKAYVELQDDDLLQEYLKAVNNLTINEENRLKTKVEELEEANSKVDNLQKQIDDLAKRLYESGQLK